MNQGDKMRKTILFVMLFLTIISCGKNNENTNSKNSKNSKNTEILPDSVVLEWFRVNKEISTLVDNYKYVALKDSSNKDSIYKELEIKRVELLKKSSFETIDSFIAIRKELTSSVKYDSLFLVNGMRIVK